MLLLLCTLRSSAFQHRVFSANCISTACIFKIFNYIRFEKKYSYTKKFYWFWPAESKYIILCRDVRKLWLVRERSTTYDKVHENSKRQYGGTRIESDNAKNRDNWKENNLQWLPQKEIDRKIKKTFFTQPAKGAVVRIVSSTGEIISIRHRLG